MTDRRFVSVPPDSSGKRVLLRGSYDLPYTNKIGAFSIGETITTLGTNTQTFSGRIIKITEESITSGYLSLMLTQDVIDEQTDPIAGENILQNSVIIARVSNVGKDLFANANVIVSHDDLTQGQLVDSGGAAYVRFSEGDPQLDSFGRLRTSTQTTLGDYNFTFNRQSLLFSELNAGSGIINHTTQTGAVELLTDGLAGSEAKFQSNLYHFYKTGTSQVIRCSVAASDTGKTGNVRRWGYFDENDGIFFQLDSTGVSVVTRSSTTGTVIDTVIPKSMWNVDRVDGSRNELNRSFLNLNPSKVNLYWIDVQWMGRLRVGVEGPGGRIVCHEISEANTNSISNLRRASLPIRFENVNTGTPGSASDLKIWNANVHEESVLDFSEVSIPVQQSSELVDIAGNNVFLMALRSEPTYFGIKNTIAAVFKTMAVQSYDTAGAPVPVKIEAFYILSPSGATGGGTWVNADNGSLVPGYNISAVEVNTTAAFAPVGMKIGEYYIHGYDNAIDISDMTVYQKAPLIRREDGLITEIVFIASKIATAGNNPQVQISLQWRELG